MNRLYYGDNLKVLRDHIATESVDLVYLDPPFNSNATYNVLFKAPDGTQSHAQIEAFEDTWHWNESAEEAFDQVKRSSNSSVADMLVAMRSFLGENDMMAYLSMMAIRLIELHRVLKSTGSLYLHCDPTASHYLKILLDAVFGPTNYLNEVIWRRTGSHNKANRFGPIHDVIHFVRKSDAYKHRAVFRPYLKGHVDSYFKKQDAHGRYWTNSIHGAGLRNGESGREWRGYDPSSKTRHWAVPSDLVTAFGIDPDLPQHEKLDALADLGLIDFPSPGSGQLPTYRQYLDRSPGMLLQDIWAYQPHTRGVLYNSPEAIDEDVRWLTAQGDEERLGYATQKPVGLLARIVAASSSADDVVLDPFCGCGTTVHAAQKFGRRWIGIDITPIAINLIRRRLGETFGVAAQFQVIGLPQDLDGAKALFEQDPHAFQLWAVSLIPDAQPWKGGKKGADTGIDGQVYLRTGSKESHRAMISVKGGRNVGVAMVRDFAHVIDRERALQGFFITLTPPTRDMETEAVKAGFVETDQGRFRKLQILTIEALLNGARAEMPFVDSTAFKRAKREEQATSQGEMDL